MEDIPNYADERQLAWCVHCGGSTETRDHIPSKVLLDEPFPDNLQIVFACTACNASFSSDEEYLACLIACVLAGTTEVNRLSREKVRRILNRKPALAARIAQGRRETAEGIAFDIQLDRVRNVVLKLARGHAAFELNEPQTKRPAKLRILPLHLMASSEREDFETFPISSIWPEVGSRAMQRIITGLSPVAGCTPWVTVQEGRYRYLAAVGDEGVTIRMVLSEYLACEVVWHDG